MKRLKPTTILEYVLLILLAGLFLFPMIWMVVSAMKPEADVYKNLTSWKAFLPSFNPADWFKPYQEVLARFSILTYLGNSIFYAGTSVWLFIGLVNHSDGNSVDSSIYNY